MFPYSNNNLSYFYRRDFTPHSEELELLAESFDADMLAEILTGITGEEWTTAPGKCSVAGASFVEMLPNKANYPTFANFSHVAIFKLSDECTDFAGNIYLTYNKE